MEEAILTCLWIDQSCLTIVHLLHDEPTPPCTHCPVLTVLHIMVEHLCYDKTILYLVFLSHRATC
jgi:hypothetical protein